MAYLAKTLTTDNGILDVVVTRHARSKRISVRYHPIKHHIAVHAPTRLSNTHIAQFIAKNEAVIRKHVSRYAQRVALQHGTHINILGKDYIIAPNEGSTNGVEHYVVMSTPQKSGYAAQKRLQSELTTFAHSVIDDICSQSDFAHIQAPTQITLRDTSSRWGSCGAKGQLMLSWRLIFAPEHVTRYVIIHECCHLIHHNHSKAFWALTKKHCSDMKKAENWLAQHGRDLFRFYISK